VEFPPTLSAGVCSDFDFLCHAADNLPANARADRLVVNKKERTLTLLDHGKLLKEYKVALGGDRVGPRTRQGDHKTPEGTYTLDRRNNHSQFYRSIHISYPSDKDRAHAHRLGVAPGGDIMLHGLPNHHGWVGSTHRAPDWTDGCVAVTNEDIDEICAPCLAALRSKSDLNIQNRQPARPTALLTHAYDID
jgi:murein L,D-transpeptidase YafK